MKNIKNNLLFVAGIGIVAGLCYKAYTEEQHNKLVADNIYSEVLRLADTNGDGLLCRTERALLLERINKRSIHGYMHVLLDWNDSDIENKIKSDLTHEVSRLREVILDYQKTKY